MKVLIFDRKIETLAFLCEHLENHGIITVAAENGSKFMCNYLDKRLDAIIAAKQELTHYGLNSIELLKKISKDITVCTYAHSAYHHIKNINIISSSHTPKNIKANEKILEIILSKCKKRADLNKDYIYSLPKKSGILLKHLIINKKNGLSDADIRIIFWGDEKLSRQNSIYNHVYNLKKSLKKSFNNRYTILKTNKRYRLIRLKKEA
ncbi:MULTISPECIES: helix-turn-helix domain-containing protein [unclassified Treponema]|uniref:helix-turn-helix domain-containing protein n=1 Tax=unclassified Treponema TaxID=2638727 RepID=UPI0020A60BBB|nr:MULTISPECIES: helix-turn-helix domain-containing protein [unclassified Treponema]UTC68134.1 helix-turn-helix domain-containing protein [Treponema sp. OMZ 789]UTC70856.1 helix-turn-helix domain-containing protein [Treponema sp. OMZ 790]UTC73596.1 helix-turn-helix domain-containing protein [Treponema sp. OMZ 791]